MESKIKPTKAVDFLCLCENRPLVMLEVKDCSLGLPETEKFARLPMTIALKTRDTIAGIIGGSYYTSHGREQSFFQDSYRRIANPPRVIYFFEDLATPARRPPQRSANKRDVLQKQLRKHLRWLTQDVAVVGLDNYSQFISDLTVRRT